MDEMSVPTTLQILAARPDGNVVDPSMPYHFLVEPEYSSAGTIQDVATIFLTNRECPFRCLMCDLWKNTTTTTPAMGMIPEQIEFALRQLPSASQIKLYNSGNFFDLAAFPKSDRRAVASLVAEFDQVIVENHPRLCNGQVLDFQQMVSGQLEVALGLETSHQTTLKRLNKQMTVDDFARACKFLVAHQIDVRAFVLLKPPWTTEEEGVQRAIESVRFAFENGVQCCAVIPTRTGNGIMEQLEQLEQFSSPKLASLESVLESTISWGAGRVFADLWDLERFSDCSVCFEARCGRLNTMNLQQVVLPSVVCDSCGGTNRGD
ncbi:MAG: radical SAM protein [Fuerstiella sp.]